MVQAAAPPLALVDELREAHGDDLLAVLRVQVGRRIAPWRRSGCPQIRHLTVDPGERRGLQKLLTNFGRSAADI
jgi:hypothetical protein